MNKKFGCIICKTVAASKKSLMDSVKTGLESGLKKGFGKIAKYTVGVFIILAVCFIPSLMSSVIYPLMGGSAKVSNAYVEKFNEFYKTPEISKDDTWLTGFNSVSQALHAFNKRCFYIRPRALKRNELLFYTLYSESSYDQMLALEKIQQAVNSSDASQIELLSSLFNRSVNNQAKALTDSYVQIFGDNAILGFYELWIDGVRFYLSYMDMDILLCGILAIGVSSMIIALVKYNTVPITRIEDFVERFNFKTSLLLTAPSPAYAPAKSPVKIMERIKSVFTGGIMVYFAKSFRAAISFLLLTLTFVFLIISIFRPRNFAGLIRRFIPSRKKKCSTIKKYDGYNASKESRRKWGSVGVIIAVFIIGTIEFWPVKVPVQNNDSPDYMDSANAVLYGAGMNFSAWLNQISHDPMNAYSETNIIAALELIDVQLEAIKNLHGYTDVPEEYSVFHDGMRSFCNDEEICLNNFKTLLYSDAKLPQKDIINYLALRGNNYLWLVEEYADLAMLNAFDSLSELV